jgi:ABC-type Fe3+ transport system substrate-binding protein
MLQFGKSRFRNVVRGRAISRIAVAIGMILSLSIGNAEAANEDLGRTAPGAWPWATLGDLVAAAKKEKELNFLGSAIVVGGTKGMQILQDALNKKYGTDVRVNYLPGPSMSNTAARVVREVGAGQASFTDIVWSPDSGGGATLYKYAREHPVHLFPDLPKGAVLTYQNRALQIMSDLPSVIYNTKKISEENVPTRLEQLTAPQWKGAASIGPGTAMWSYLPFIIGEKNTTEFINRLAAIKPAIIRCGEDARIASGEFSFFAISCGNYGVRQLQETGAPIASRILQDACIILHWSLLVPKTSEHPALAHLFSAFLATPEGQEAYWRAAKVADVFWDTPTKKELDAVQATGAQCLDTGGDFQEIHADEMDRYSKTYAQTLGG